MTTNNPADIKLKTTLGRYNLLHLLVLHSVVHKNGAAAGASLFYLYFFLVHDKRRTLKKALASFLQFLRGLKLLMYAALRRLGP